MIRYRRSLNYKLFRPLGLVNTQSKIAICWETDDWQHNDIISTLREIKSFQGLGGVWSQD